MIKLLQRISLLGLLFVTLPLLAHPHESVLHEMTHHAYAILNLDSLLILLSAMAVAFVIFNKRD